ncbi:hypothetical protein L2725_08835 [Shewanella corallii]|uniref:Uncharacterized protein n=1 Tax=Shewanella corallii TaxID=560080 RepID=A0ABT0N651_9GAMM|nr:hypothetical protein [Shewanella corallii]MCL2913898.1 hypothetical protein [Shewanella corallii]
MHPCRPRFSQFQHQDPAINALREKVRYATEEDNPGLVLLWLSAEETSLNNDMEAARVLFQAQYQLLLDTLADDLNPPHWRLWCLDNIYRPLQGLSRLASTARQQAHLRNLLVELRLTTQYCRTALHQ